MQPERWQQIDQLFHLALDKERDERELFLAQACAGDDTLRTEVEELISSHEEAKDFIETPASDLAAELLAKGQSGLRLGEKIGPYEIQSVLGIGGMGEVYLATDTRLSRRVALKLLPPRFTFDAERVRRFEQEARAASALNHPNIVTIHEIGHVNSTHFIVTELVEGQTLRQLMNEKPFSLNEALNVTIQVAVALTSAHAAGIVHRDIKPENIMLRADGYVKILDFGLAKLTETQTSGSDLETPTLLQSNPELLMGTVQYMSPEQARRKHVDLRTDVWSLGIVLYELLAGRVPFTGETPSHVMVSLMDDELLPLTTYAQVPIELNRIVDKALRKNKKERYQTARQLAHDLKELKRELQLQAPADAKKLTSIETGKRRLIANDQAEGKLETFVGREAELKRLEELLEQAAAGAGRMVFITGEPGIGKTTLADEFLRRSRKRYPGFLLARGRCVEQYGTGEAYLPFLDAMASLLAGPGRERVAAMLRTYAPTWCLQLPAVFASSGDLERFQRETIGATKERLLREMGDALGALTADALLVILLEDLHWADPSSADLLSSLCQRTGGQRLMIVGTFRPEDLEISNHVLKTYKLEMQSHNLCDEIALGSLSDEHIASYVDARFAPNDFPAELPALIRRKTEGHPLFVTSLVQFLAERRDIVRVNAHWSLARPISELDLEVPESVRSMIRKKIDALEEEDRRALQYASVEGEEFISTVAAKLLGTNDLILEERLDRLDKVHRLIQSLGEEELPDGRVTTRYRFAHALFQNVLYGDLVSKRRTLLHRQAGEQLVEHFGDQAPRIATQLAMHFERGRDFPRAIGYLTQAGDNAIKLYANAEAEANYSHALSLVERLPHEQQSERYLNLFEKRGRANLALTRLQPSLDDFTRMLELARASCAAVPECAALNALANTFFYSHRLEEMGARAEEAVSVAERSGDERARVEALVLLAMKRNGTGELAEAKLLYDEAIAGARHLKHHPALVRGLVYRGVVHFFQTEYELAEELVREALQLASEVRDGFTLLQSHFFLGLVLGNQGRMSEALQILEEALAMAQRNGDRIILARVPNAMGWIYRELGDFDQAIQYDRQSVEIARQHQIVEAEANSLINLGQDYTRRREGEKALSCFREAETVFDRDEWLRWRFRDIRYHAGATEHWLLQGEVGRAEGHAQKLLENATRHKVPKYIAIAHKLLAEIAARTGQLAEAEAELGAALDQLRTHPVPILAWKIYAALGRVRLQLDDDQSARATFAQAAAIIDTIAAGVNDKRLQSRFLNSEAVREVFDGLGTVVQV